VTVSHAYVKVAHQAADGWVSLRTTADTGQRQHLLLGEILIELERVVWLLAELGLHLPVFGPSKKAIRKSLAAQDRSGDDRI